MQKLIVIIESVLDLFRLIFGKAAQRADTSDTNVSALETGLEMAPGTIEVIEARQKLMEIMALPPEVRVTKDAEIRKIEEIVEKEVKAKAPDISKPEIRNELIDQIRDAEARRARQRNNQ